MDHDRPEDSAPAAGRRRFLKHAGALAVVAPLAAALHAAAQAGDADAAVARKKAKPARPPAEPDPFASARPDTSICRTAEERATLERQWKGMVDLVKVIRDAPLDPSVEPATAFAALPREV